MIACVCLFCLRNCNQRSIISDCTNIGFLDPTDRDPDNRYKHRLTNHTIASKMVNISTLLLSLIVFLSPLSKAELPREEVEYQTFSYKRAACEGRILETADVPTCSSSPDRRGLYIKTTCAGKVISKTGYKSKACRGTPQSQEFESTGCVNSENGKTSINTECLILELNNGPSPSKSERESVAMLVALVFAAVTLITMFF